ncbi:MAG: 50S ribosomal protein L9 [Chloroflexi bacterium]|nr:50S ribosomal protein L9 [Chloroflexota bacterium]
MKVLLLKTVPNLGKDGDIKEVANGYARNYLLPRGLAVPATPTQIKLIQQQQEALARREQKNRAELESLAQQLAGITVTIRTKTGSGGRLYGSVTNKDIGDALQQQAGIDIDRHMIELADPIRMIGTHSVPIHVASNLRPQVTVTIEEEL